MSSTPITPWYREFWAWFVLAIVGMGVCSGIGVLAIGLNNPPQMVTGDYRPLGKVLVDTHERADRARELGLSARMSFGAHGVELVVASRPGGTLPESLLVRLEHPTDSNADRSVVVHTAGAGRYRGELPVATPPRARIIVSDLERTWWLSGRFDASVTETVDLAPERL